MPVYQKTKGKANIKASKERNNVKSINKPVIFISKRRKMTQHEAKTQSITKENQVTSVRSLKAGKKFIKNSTECANVYVLRDDKGKMIESYSFHKNAWNPIRMGGYFGGYKIGEPRPICSCGFGKCNDPLHPTYKKA
jgi:hypothetical protein